MQSPLPPHSWEEHAQAWFANLRWLWHQHTDPAGFLAAMTHQQTRIWWSVWRQRVALVVGLVGLLGIFAWLSGHSWAIMSAHAILPPTLMMTLAGLIIMTGGRTQFWISFLISPLVLVTSLLCGIGPLWYPGWLLGWVLLWPWLVGTMIPTAGALWVQERSAEAAKQRRALTPGGLDATLPALPAWQRIRWIRLGAALLKAVLACLIAILYQPDVLALLFALGLLMAVVGCLHLDALLLTWMGWQPLVVVRPHESEPQVTATYSGREALFAPLPQRQQALGIAGDWCLGSKAVIALMSQGTLAPQVRRAVNTLPDDEAHQLLLALSVQLGGGAALAYLRPELPLPLQPIAACYSALAYEASKPPTLQQWPTLLDRFTKELTPPAPSAAHPVEALQQARAALALLADAPVMGQALCAIHTLALMLAPASPSESATTNQSPTSESWPTALHRALETHHQHLRQVPQASTEALQEPPETTSAEQPRPSNTTPQTEHRARLPHVFAAGRPEEIVIRLRRQTYAPYEQANQPPAFQAEVIRAPGPGKLAGGAFRLDAADVLTRFHNRIKNYARLTKMLRQGNGTGASEEEAELARKLLTEMGQDLYGMLPETFQEQFPRLIQSILERERTLCLVIEARAEDEAGQLLSLPWELLAFRNTKTFPAQSPRLVIVRRLLDAPRRAAFEVETPPRVLHVFSHDPDHAVWRIDPSLKVAEEAAIREVVGPEGYISVEDPGSVEALTEKLGIHNVNMLHFLGHGVVSKAGTNGNANPALHQAYLRFVDDQRQPQPVTGGHLQQLLNHAPKLQAVVLNACHGGAPSGANVAIDLVYNGFPYVVAMQNEISQKAAGSFASAFYNAIKQGSSIEQAVAMGRAKIAEQMPGTLEWCLPMLFTNTGLPEKSWFVRLNERFAHGFLSEDGTLDQTLWLAFLGAGHLLVGFWWLANGTVFPVPTQFVSFSQTLWLAAVPSVLTWLAARSGEVQVPENTKVWDRNLVLTLLMRMWVGASVGWCLGLTNLWVFLALIASILPWEQLILPGRIFLILPWLLVALLMSASQAISQGRWFVSNTKVGREGLELGDLMMVAVFHLLLFSPPFLQGLWDPLQLNLVLGGLMVGMSRMVWNMGKRS